MKLPTKLQTTRRTVQMLVLLLTVAVPVLARYANYLSARQLDKVVERFDGSVQAAALRVTDRALLLATGTERVRAELNGADRQAVLVAARHVRGSTWSLELFGVSLTDPLAALESAAASRTVRRVLLVGIVIPVLGTILLGRVFCSWICPVGFLLELTGKVRGLLRFLELKPGKARLWAGDKYLVLALGVTASFVIGLPVLGYLYPPALLGREVHNGVTVMFDRAENGLLGFSAAGLSIASWFLLAIAFVEIAFAPRVWCRALCPGGGLYAALGRFRLIRVRRRPDRCTECGECVIVCQMGLSPMTDRTGTECDNCGACIAVCPDDALGFVRSIRDAKPAREVKA